MPGNFRAEVEGYRFWDSTGSLNAMGRYQCVSLATAAEVAAAVAAGFPAKAGETVVQTPITTGLATRRVVGVTIDSAKCGQTILVAVSGIAWAMAGAAIAEHTLVQGGLSETRTSAQSPFVDNFEMLIPADPSFTVTYNMALIDDTAKPASGTTYFPVGYVLEPATAKYDIIPIELIKGEGR